MPARAKRPTKTSVSQALTRAGCRAYHVRRQTAFGGHQTHDWYDGAVRVGWRPGDDVADDLIESERAEWLASYIRVLESLGYVVEPIAGALLVKGAE